MILKLPDVRMTDEWDCGGTAYRCVLAFLERPLPPLRETMLSNPVQGLSPSTMESLLREAGLNVLSGRMRVNDLKHFCSSGRPVLCPINQDGGHWVVVAGLERGFVHYHDPSWGPQRMRAHDWTIKWIDTCSAGHVYSNWGIACG